MKVVIVSFLRYDAPQRPLPGTQIQQYPILILLLKNTHVKVVGRKLKDDFIAYRVVMMSDNLTD